MGVCAPEARGGHKLAPNEPNRTNDGAATGEHEGVHLQCERRGWVQVSGRGGGIQRVNDPSAPCTSRNCCAKKNHIKSENIFVCRVRADPQPKSTFASQLSPAGKSE
jgi:hypothetical protein